MCNRNLVKYDMSNESLAVHGYSIERKDRNNGRGGGVARYVRNYVFYKRLDSLEDDELEDIWMKIMPQKLPRRLSCAITSSCVLTQLFVSIQNVVSL